VVDREHGGGHADSDAQDEHDFGREAGATPERADGEAEILPDSDHCRHIPPEPNTYSARRTMIGSTRTARLAGG
jgi:hypothetical protein